MPSPRELSQGRIAVAFTVAVLADLVQIPLNLLMFTGWLAIPSELGDMFIDAVTFGITVQVLGFHWILLPTAALELMPIGDVFPTWTGCVAFVVWQRKKESAAALREPAVRTIEARNVTPPVARLKLDPRTLRTES